MLYPGGRCLKEHDIAGGFQGVQGTWAFQVQDDEECQQKCIDKGDCTAWVKDGNGKSCWLSQQKGFVEFHEERERGRNTGLKHCNTTTFPGNPSRYT